MQNETDVVLEAIDKLKDYLMQHMLADKAPDAAPSEHGNEPPADDAPDAELEIDLDAGGEPEPDEDTEPKNSVLRRYDFAGAKLPRSNSAKMPVKRR